MGDTVIVNLTLSGLQSDEDYGVIADELPSGLVPINESFKNEQYNQDQNSFDYYNFTDKEVTENGMVLSLYRMHSGETTYTYKA